MKFFKKTICATLSLLLLLSLFGCEGEEYSAAIYADIGGKVSTLDPQLADTATDRLVVLNLFQGLMRLDENGDAVPAAAKSIEKSGNTYTFYLKENLKWSDGSSLTAEDFAYGLRRAADDSTAAPDFDSISCIMGASALHSGDGENLSGVMVDGNKITITLERDDRDFLKTLAKPICMPCDEEFFLSTKGKYGRDKDSLLSNGAFYLGAWNTEDYLVRIRRNEYYAGETPIPASVYFSSADETKRQELLSKNSLDLAFVPCDSSDKLKASGLSVNKYYNRCWYIFINGNSPLGDDSVKRALRTSIHRNHIENEVPTYIKPLTVAMPYTATLDGSVLYDKIISANSISYNPDEAYSLYSQTSFALKNTSPTIIYAADGKINAAVGELAAGWQQTLGCFVNITEYATNGGVISTVKNGLYEIAVGSIDAKSSDPYDYLCNFKSGNSYGFQSAEFDRLVDSLPTLSGDEFITTAIKAEKILLDSCSIIPLCATSTDLAYSSRLSQVDYNINGGFIDFSKIVKK